MKIHLKHHFYTLFMGIFFFVGTSFGIAVERDSIKTPDNWFLLDPLEDGFMGTGTEKAYDLILKDKSPKQTVIVAVIDSGIDLDHEDLEGKIWVNEGEIPGNGIDDDGNGYVDDVNGWNFIGGPDGSHVDADSHELTREFVRLKARYGEMEQDEVKRRNREEFAYWKRVKANFEESQKEAEMNYNMYSNMLKGFSGMAELLKEKFELDNFRKADLEDFDTSDEKVDGAVDMMNQLFSMVNMQDPGINEILEMLEEAVEHYKVQAEYAYNTDFDPRAIVGDDPDDYTEKYYGNNDPTGPDPSHGTHVAGIIAAKRGNNIGVDGIAEHVLIMPIRAVPNGDERDKDIANAIRYAVDNGAHIINMSFGKSYSPGKKQVDKAVKYAARKGVLLIHAAGNSSKEISPDNNFPNRWYERRGESNSWLEVGASSSLDGENLPADFSNFSKERVDLFAPGVDIYSTVPGSDYKSNSGTSMAAPTVSGVAALLMAYYPDLKAKEVRSILRSSVYKPEVVEVNLPGEEKTTRFDELSGTGGLVNAYQAVQMAESMEK